MANEVRVSGSARGDSGRCQPPPGFDAIEYINEPRWRDMSLGLHRIKAQLGELGDPHLRVPCVHVAGTNGKGSTCSYLAQMLYESGCKTGLFTSPYIERFEERIQVDGVMIDEGKLASIAWEVKCSADAVESALGEHPTEFELMFACAASYFAEQHCDIAVIECGLGGRLDATNCVVPELSVITPISLDHIAILGDTLAKIATEKAGIIKPNVPVVCALQPPDALGVIIEACARCDSPLRVLDVSLVHTEGIDVKSMTQRFSFEGVAYETSILGTCQPQNASLAILAAQDLRRRGFGQISDQSIRDGISKARWPGRFEVIARAGLPIVIIDGAHNAEGAISFASSLERLLASAARSWDDVVAVCGVLADKDHDSIIRPLSGKVRRWVAYAPDNPRALSATDLAGKLDAVGCEAACAQDAEDAIRIALEMAGPEGVVAAFGSLYGISSVRRGLPLS